MAPLSHLALAALAMTSVAAAPLPTQPSSTATLQPRGLLHDLLEEMNMFGKWMDGKTKVKTKSMLENALEVEKQLKEEHDKRDEDGVEEFRYRICAMYPLWRIEACRLKKGGDHQERN